MSGFDPNEYFNRRASEIDAADRLVNPADKLAQVEQAGIRARDALAQKAVILQEHQDANAKSWVGKLGLSPHGIPGQAVDLGAHAVSGALHMGADIGSFLSSDLWGMYSEAGLSDDQKAAFNRYVQGTASEDDKFLINHRPEGAPTGFKTPLEAIQQAASYRQRGQDIRDSVNEVASGLPQQDGANELNAALGANFPSDWAQTQKGAVAVIDGDQESRLAGAGDAVAGIAKLIYHAGEAAVTHPKGVAGYIAENAPQLLAGGAGKVGEGVMMMSNIGYASDYYQKGIQKYQADNNGQVPDDATKGKLAAWASSLALAEHGGNVLELGAAKGAAHAVAEGGKTGLIQSAKNVAHAALEGGLEETLTEGYQGYAEGQASLSPASAQDVYENAVIGGLAGAGLTGGGRSVGEALKATPEHAEKRAQDAATTQTKNEVQAQAIATGDVTALTDQKSPTYDPVRAIAALNGNSKMAGATEEAKTANLDKATAVVAALEKERAAVQNQHDIMSPEGIKALQDVVAKAQAAGDTATVNDMQPVIDQALTDSKNLPAVASKLAKLNAQLEQAHQTMSQFRAEMAPKEEVDAAVETLKAPAEEVTPEARTEAANKIITFSMVSPSSVAPETASTLASDTTNGLTDEQRDYLRKYVEAAPLADQLADMGKVSHTVFAGEKGSLGIAQYRSGVTTAISVGDQETANRMLALMDKFQKGQANKADAWARARAAGVQAVQDGNGLWKLETERVRGEKIKDHRRINSQKLVDNVAFEAKAIATARAALQAAYDLKFSNGGVSNVQNVSQPHAPASVQPAQQQAPQAVGSPVPATPGSGSAQRPAGERPGVQASGVAIPRVQVGTDKDSFINQNAQSNRDDADRRGLTADIEAMFAEGRTAASVRHAMDKRLSFLDVAERPNYLIGVRATLGIPSRASAEGEKEFDEWKAARDARLQKTESTAVDSAELQASTDAVSAGKTQSTGRTEGKTHSTEKSTSAQEQSQKVGQAETGNLSQSAEQTSEDSKESAAQPDGKLEVMGSKSEEGTAYNLRHLIADYFTQTAGREGDRTARPLVAVKNFLTTGFDRVGEFLGLSQDEMDAPGWGKKTAALELVRNAYKAWAPNIRENLFERDSKSLPFAFEDLMSFFQIEGQDGNPDIEENVKLALVVTAIQTTVDQINRPASDADVNALLGRDEDTAVTDWERGRLAGLVRQNVLVDRAGAQVVQALGLKATKDAPIDLAPRLRSAFGAHVVKLLLDQQILDRREIGAEEYASLRGTEGELSEDKAHTSHIFLRMHKEDGKLNKKAARLQEVTRHTQDVIGKLFDVESSLVDPSLEPIKTKQKSIRNSIMGIPSKLAKMVAHENAQPNHVREDMWDLVKRISEDTLMRIAGAEDVETKHAANRDSIEAKNDGLQREIDRFKDFVGDVLEQAADGIKSAMYFEHSVWKQQRVGIATNAVNPQSSKIHRHLVYRPTWESTVNFDNDAQLENFRLRVAEGLGVKTDKNLKQAALDELKSKLADPKIAAAVKALQTSLTMTGDTMLESDQKALVEGVQVAGEEMHSLDALLAWARYQHAVAQGETSFKTALTGEVDGVTNGPMLTHLLLGAKSSVGELFGLLQRGGIYAKDSTYSQYNQWRGAPGQAHSDLYETMAADMVRNIQGLVNETGSKLGPVFSAIYEFTGQLVKPDGSVASAGRNIVKTPLTAMVFGSQVETAVGNMAEKFIEALYSKIEDAKSGKSRVTAKQIVDQINVLLDHAGAKKLPAMSIEQLMEFDLKAQLPVLRRVFSDTVGYAVGQTMESEFSVFTERRKQFNKTAKVAFTLYDTVYKVLREQRMDELVKSGEIPLSGKEGDKVREPMHDLTQAQEAEVRQQAEAMFPVANTLLSKESGSLKGGLFIGKSGRVLSQRQTFSSKVKFGKAVPGATAWSSKTKQQVPVKSMGTHGYEDVQEDPGVAMLPMLIHSTDSYISHVAAMLSQVLNIHDAHATGLDGVLDAARNLNEATFQAMLNYSPAEEMHQALSRTVQGLASMIKEGKLPTEVHAKLVEQMGSLNRKGPAKAVAAALLGSRSLAYDADKVRLGTLAQSGFFDQYAMEGGNYEVSDKDREEATRQEGELSNALTADEGAALGEVMRYLSGKAEKVPTAVEAEASAGKVGTSTRNDPELVDLFKVKAVLPAQQVIQALEKKLGAATGRTNEFSAQLLRLLRKTVSPDLTVRMVSPETAPSDILALPKQTSLGWFVSDGSKSEIYVLGPGYENSNLTVEVLLHELTHGVLAQVVAREQQAKQANPKYTSEALQLIEELEQLRALATDYARQQGITEFDAALADVQELITWGMTNTSFQRQVLSQISMPSSTGSTTLVNGMKAFIQKVVGILFRGSQRSEQDRAVNGMTVLVGNVSGLFNQAAQDPVRSQETLNLSMASKVQSYSTLDIHAALPGANVTAEFDTKLRDLLSGIVQKLHGPFGALEAMMRKTQAFTPFDAWQKAVDTGKAPFASTLVGAPLVISERERHAMEQVEVTVRAALGSEEASAKQAYRELRRLYEEMRAKLKPADFKSQAAYDFVFDLAPDAEGRSEHLARFAAFGLANQEFNDILAGKTTSANRRIRDGSSFIQRFQILFEQILEFFHGDLALSYGGQQADNKLTQLVGKLVDVEAKRRVTIAARALGPNKLEQAATNVAESVRGTVIKAVNSNFVRNNKYQLVRTAGKLANVRANHRVAEFLDGIAALRDQVSDETYGLPSGFLNELRGPGEMLNALQLASTNQQRQRKQIISSSAKIVLDAFEGGDTLSQDTKKALSAVFLRTGMHVLVQDGRLNMGELENLMGNRTVTEAKISDLESQLTGRFKDHFIAQANGLAAYKATGRIHEAVQMLNAHNIARLGGTPYRARITEMESQKIEKIIEQLVPLYALDYLDKGLVVEAKRVLATENAKTTGGNGVEFTLKLQAELEQQARDRLFDGQEALMMLGYTPEIFNPHTEVKVANEVDGQELEYGGYVKQGRVALDPFNPDRQIKHVYTLKDGGLAPYVTGSISTTRLHTKGTTEHNGYMDAIPAGDHAKMTNEKLARPLASGPRRLLTANDKTYQAPVVNPAGDIVNWRYLMHEDTKDVALERNNDFESILGALAGSIYDKQTSQELNQKVLEALHQVYQDQGSKTPEAFVRVGPAGSSKDPELQEIWKLLPPATRAAAQDLFGPLGIMVRRDAVTTVFGYRKISLADAFEKDPALRTKLEQVFVASMEWIIAGWGKAVRGMDKDEALRFAKKAAQTVAKGERIWQELMHEVKDIIVVKSGVVLLGNIYSNLSLLALQGVSPKDILNGHLVALRGVRDYQANVQRIAEIEARLATKLTLGNEKELKRELATLQDSMARNPVKELIDAGLMPTIAEDQANEDDRYSYKSELTQFTDRFTSKLNPHVLTAAKTVLLAKDTYVYKSMSHITQLSDFVARYTLYQHLTNRAKNPLSKSAAIFEASESFINYDVPMHRTLQWMDDNGFLMFMKYFMRIQRVLLRLAKDNPGRVLMTTALHHFMSLGPIVLDSDWITRVGNNPFSWGALQLPGTLPDLASVSSTMALLK